MKLIAAWAVNVPAVSFGCFVCLKIETVIETAEFGFFCTAERTATRVAGG